MNVTIEVVCYKSKVLANNEYPLMLRVTKNRKRKYSSIGISVHPDNWDFQKNKPRRNCPNRVQIERIISAKLKEYREQVLEYKAENKEFTAVSLVEKVKDPTQAQTVGEVFMAQIASLKKQRRTGYALSHLEVFNSLIKFNGHLDIYFSDITTTWLKNYEVWLRTTGVSENTIGRRFRTLRAVFNVAIEQNIVKEQYYPFKSYKVSKLQKATAKRAITKDDITKIVAYKSDNSYAILAIDLFVFSYLTGGINFVDMAYMTADNIIEGRLVYTRKKTGKLIRLPLQANALAIIYKHISNKSKYIFPILFDGHKTEQAQRNRIHKVITKVNKHLKDIGKDLDVPISLTTYTARHSVLSFAL